MGERASLTSGTRRRRVLGDAGGAFGDLGTFLPYAIGAMTVGGLAPAGLLLGFGLFFVASGLIYGLPMAVQPMKVVGAVLLTGDIGPGEIAATGLIMGVALIGLGATGAIGFIARAIPQSVSAGLQLGIGVAMALIGFELMTGVLWFGVLVLAVLLALMRVPRCPAAPATLLVAIAAGYAAGLIAPPDWPTFRFALPAFALPDWPAAGRALDQAVLPQLPLTLTNAVIVAAALAHSLFPDAAHRVSERRLALSSGVANLALAPFGALPMCHGAGGLQAQYRFGARTGLAPMLIGSLLIVLALGFADASVALLGLIPMPAVGVLLLVAGADLALSRRLFDAKPDCWPAILLTAALVAFVNPALALIAGWTVETVRGPGKRWLRRLLPPARS
jgi:MFS superfamily sulfate permease-like transporter